jgi:hypothetical protein
MMRPEAHNYMGRDQNKILISLLLFLKKLKVFSPAIVEIYFFKINKIYLRD